MDGLLLTVFWEFIITLNGVTILDYTYKFCQFFYEVLRSAIVSFIFCVMHRPEVNQDSGRNM